MQFKLKDAAAALLPACSPAPTVSRRTGARSGGVLRRQDRRSTPWAAARSRLKQWRRGSLIVLERNPDYRERLYDEQPAADDARGQQILARLKGRKHPDA